MARSVNDIYASLVAAKDADTELAGLTSTSQTAIWRLWLWLVATAMYVHEGLFDAHKAEVTAIVNSQRAHRGSWYVGKAKAFQYGDVLPADSDVYATIREAGDAALIVTEASYKDMSNKLRLKVATGSAGALSGLDAGQQTAFGAYINAIKDAGVRVEVVTGDGDDLQIELTVYFDAMVLDSTGARIDGTASNPVKTAVNAFLAAVPFDGFFRLNAFAESLLAVEGVKDVRLVSVQARYDAHSYEDVVVQYQANYGYCKLDDTFFDANLNFINYATIA